MRKAKLLNLLVCVLFVATNTMAQSYQQRGVVRMITTSASSPVTPVAGVKVAVGEYTSNATDKNGAFTMNVTKKFQVNGVTPSDKYVLALPTKGKDYFLSQNELDVVVTTNTQKDEDYKRLYMQLRKKYRQQSNELNLLKQNYQDRLDELNETDADYSKIKAAYDSLQALYAEYITNEQKIDDEIKRIAEGLAITDYISLGAIERRIYDLKVQGEWRSIIELTREVMRGDAATFLQEGIDLEKLKQEELKRAQLDYATRFNIVERAIESFKVEHENDSVSSLYRILTGKAPSNMQYHVDAGLFELEYREQPGMARGYFMSALRLAETQSDSVKLYELIGMTFMKERDFSQAHKCFDKAMAVIDSSQGISKSLESELYMRKGEAFTEEGLYAEGLAYLEKSLVSCKEIPGGNIELEADIYFSMAMFCSTAIKYEWSSTEGYLNKAIALYDSTSVKLADCYRQAAKMRIHGSYMNCLIALEYFKDAIKIYRTHYGENNTKLADCYMSSYYYADFYGYSEGFGIEEIEEMGTGEVMLRRALDIYKNVYGEDSEEYSSITNAIEDDSSNEQDDDKKLAEEAIAFFNKLIEMEQKLFGEYAPQIGRSFRALGEQYYILGDDDTGMKYFKKASSILRYSQDYDDKIEKVICDFNVANTYAEKGNSLNAVLWYLDCHYTVDSLRNVYPYSIDPVLSKIYPDMEVSRIMEVPETGARIIASMEAMVVAGDDEIARKLGDMYSGGIGVEEDEAKAQYWYGVAKNKGIKEDKLQ